MKIKRNIPSQLILENNPVWLAVLFSVSGLICVAAGLFHLSSNFEDGALFIGVGLLLVIVCNMIFVRRTQLILDASRGRIELRRKGWLRYVSMSWDLRHLDRAVEQEMRADRSRTYRAALVIDGGMDAGTHPITLVYSSGKGAARTVEAINAWHAALDSQPSRA